MRYEIIATADYSGAQSIAAQKKHIYLVSAQVKNLHMEILSNISRDELSEQIQFLIQKSHADKKYCLVGFDFSFGFPSHFLKLIVKRKFSSWHDQLRVLIRGTKNLPPLVENPGAWTEWINEFFSREYHTAGGPFWGPGSHLVKNPRFPFHDLGFSSLRLIEQRIPRMKSIFQIGGIGSVGLQALYGISQIEKMLSFFRKHSIPVHVWPFDGWRPAAGKHLICEIYPAIYNNGPKGDLEDALSSTQWFMNRIHDNSLLSAFTPELTNTERQQAILEGWIPGIR